ncbi:SAM-dependent methyltransferase [Priestia megaterium]
MLNERLFGPYKKKVNTNNISLVDDFYSDQDFVDFYNQALKNDSYKDLDIFKANLSFNDTILEIGSGSGRIFNTLSKTGYNLYGIEPSLEMNKYILDEYKHKIFNTKVQHLDELINKKLLFSKILIPATTVSLFSHQDFEVFIEKSASLLSPNGSLIFDFIDPQYLASIDKKINILNYKDSKYYFSNYIKYPFFILNVFMQNESVSKLSYSTKHLYSLEYLEELCRLNNYILNVIYKDNMYVMVEMKRNE